MVPRVFIIHGWSGYPEECWFIWLQKQLQAKGFTAFVPQMPETDNPTIKVWVNFLAKLVGSPDEETFFVGHSIGCQTIVRYLEKINTPVGGAVFVAGWFDLENLETTEEQKIAKPWIETTINFGKVRKNTSKLVAILSDNDSFGCLQKNQDVYRKKLGAKIIIEHAKGHFGREDKVFRLPVALQEVVKMIQPRP